MITPSLSGVLAAEEADKGDDWQVSFLFPLKTETGASSVPHKMFYGSHCT